MYDVFGAVIFHGAFPVAKRLECYSQQPRIVQFSGGSFPLQTKVVSMMA
jgi:hypothetical protein